jgi:hypothetical protein
VTESAVTDERVESAIKAALTLLLGNAEEGHDEVVGIDDLARVLRHLEQVALAASMGSTPESYGEETLTPPPVDHPGLREHLGSRFPGFGLYQLEDVEDGSIEDAIDDLMDITRDLSQVFLASKDPSKRRREFVRSYEIHWGQHLRNLRRLLAGETSPL